MDIRKAITQKPMEWYADNKFLIGVILVILSFVLGIYGKVLIFAKFYEPIQLLTGISIYAFSFVLLFLGAFLVGWRTIRMIKSRIYRNTQKTAKLTYNHARKFPKKAANYTKKLHRRSMDRINKTSRSIAGKMRQ